MIVIILLFSILLEQAKKCLTCSTFHCLYNMNNQARACMVTNNVASSSLTTFTLLALISCLAPAQQTLFLPSTTFCALSPICILGRSVPSLSSLLTFSCLCVSYLNGCRCPGGQFNLLALRNIWPKPLSTMKPINHLTSMESWQVQPFLLLCTYVEEKLV